MAYYYTKERGIASPVQGQSKGFAKAIRTLEAGESMLLPTTASSLVSLVGYLRRRGEAKAGEFTVQSQGPKSARIWRLAVSAGNSDQT